MTGYRVRFTPEAARLVARLHPENKKIIRDALDTLRENPFAGDDLQDELSGFKSFKPKRFRILYTVDESDPMIQVYYVGHRKDVYEKFRLLLNTLNP